MLYFVKQSWGYKILRRDGNKSVQFGAAVGKHLDVLMRHGINVGWIGKKYFVCPE